MAFGSLRWAAVMTLVCSAAASGCNDIGDTVTPPVDAGSEGPLAADATEEAEAARDAIAEESAALEAEPDDPDAPHGDAVAVLAMRNPDCSECALANCQSYVNGCNQVAGKASGGPAVGTPHSVLCSETLTCLLDTGCADLDQKTCVCGPFTVTGLSSDCVNFPETATGPCKSVFERGYEATNPKDIIASYTDLSKGGGWATLLYRCLFDFQCTACFVDHGDGGDGGDGGD
jgi:hypothetical protein